MPMETSSLRFAVTSDINSNPSLRIAMSISSSGFTGIGFPGR